MLEWNVYYEDFNNRCIDIDNIFDHIWFLDDCIKAAKKVHVKEDIPEEKVEFLKAVKRSLAYYFWSKCEWEIVLTSWPNGKIGFEDRKVDVYDQVLLNWKVFSEYIWNHRGKLKRMAREKK